jgi:tetratricopeptide (TPR) repeat protein
LLLFFKKEDFFLSSLLEQTALSLKAAGRFDEAAAAFAALARQQPKNHGPLYNLGNTYLAANRPADAIDPFRRAIRLAPRFAHAHNNLGLALLATGQPELAAASFARAAALDPANPGPRHLAGHALLRAQKPAEALPHLRQANDLAPQQPAIITDLADALRRTGALREVAPLARLAAALAPDRVEAWNNLANALRDIAAFDEAEAASRNALRLAPDHGEAHYNLALTLLTAGKLQQAWPHWEHRWRGVVGAAPRFATPPWDGAPIGDGTLYLHAEQGLGDTIQFCRYAPCAATRARVVLAVQPPLLTLMRDLPGVADVVDLNAPPPPFAAHAPLLSLPAAFGTVLDTIPANVPYLRADPARTAHWQARLAGFAGRRIGLVWAGNPDFPFDSARSIPPALFDRLAGVPDAGFVSLQVGARSRPNLDLIDWTGELHDFADTAALISALDLVIGIDTAVIHLAGALARPVWLLNRFAPDWRWGAAGDTTPWYPTLRQFRQRDPGAWRPVLDAVNAALA